MSANSTAINSFNENHSSYDQLRPEFSKKIVNRLLLDLKLSEIDHETKQVKHNTKKTILELAIGTGKFTKQIIESGWGKDDNLIGIEPSKGMLSTFHENYPTIDARLGSSYEIPLPDDSVDAIIVAQGFHWFSDERSLAEMNRVLKKEDGTGYLGLIWNYDYAYEALKMSSNDTNYDILFENVQSEYEFTKIEDKYPQQEIPYEVSKAFFSTVGWAEKLTSYVVSFDGAVPQYRHSNWRSALKKDEGKFFAPISKESFLLKYDSVKVESLSDYWATRSYITALPAEQKTDFDKNVKLLTAKYVTERDLVAPGISRRAMGTHAVVAKALRRLIK